MPNRHIPCKDCGNAKWLSQKQFKQRLELEGSPKKVKRRFQCMDCRKLEREDLFTFQMKYGKNVKKIRTELRKSVNNFYKTNNLPELRRQIDQIFLKCGIDPMKLVFHKSSSGSGRLLGITVKDYPFIGELYISIYTERQIDKTPTDENAEK